MEYDKLKELFSNFQPELQSDFDFINRLERNLNAVEEVKRQSESQKRSMRLSFAAGAAAGLAAGFLMSRLVPYMTAFLSNLSLTMPGNAIAGLVSEYQQTIAWFAVGTISMVMAVNAFDLMQTFVTTNPQNSR